MITTQVSYEYETSDFDEKEIVKNTESICRKLGLENVFVSIVILDDKNITAANKAFLKHDYATDVISFDLSDDDEEEKIYEMLVNGELAARESINRGHKQFAELMLYITHGLLHNLGYDDSTEDSAAKMHNKEDELLESQGLGKVFSQNRGKAKELG